MVGEPNAVLEPIGRRPSRVEQGVGIGALWARLGVRRASATSIVAVGVVLVVILLAIFADRVAPFDPLAGDYSVVRQPPTAIHWLGTDDVGRDVLSRLIYGARTSLAVGFGAVLIGDIVGLMWGVASGYNGRRFGLLRQRVVGGGVGFPRPVLGAVVLLGVGGGV